MSERNCEDLPVLEKKHSGILSFFYWVKFDIDYNDAFHCDQYATMEKYFEIPRAHPIAQRMKIIADVHLDHVAAKPHFMALCDEYLYDDIMSYDMSERNREELPTLEKKYRGILSLFYWVKCDRDYNDAFRRDQYATMEKYFEIPRASPLARQIKALADAHADPAEAKRLFLVLCDEHLFAEFMAPYDDIAFW